MGKRDIRLSINPKIAMLAEIDQPRRLFEFSELVLGFLGGNDEQRPPFMVDSMQLGLEPGF